MNETTALQSLPHGPEFRFIDRLTRLDPGRSGSGEYSVRGNEDFLRGHFPGAPIFPGVLIIEACAQLAGVIAQSDLQILPLKNLRLTAVRNVKILGSAHPGEVISVEAQISGRMANLVQATAKALVADRVIVHAEVTLSGEF